ncbi:MAG TPA: OmpA family protein [Saprospiraceae bacterium]|nr:OmpA family protein [Saprospiraceae bacterium]HMP24875.1 OmpA family protein [Saprospiraceae bacterium]
MTAFPKIIIMLVIWLLYTILVWRGCTEELCTGCGAGAITSVPADTGAVAPQRYALDFRWSDPTAFTSDGFAALKQSILAKGSNEGILQITGFYFEGEPKPDGFENMGFARADRVRALFAADVPNERIRLRARLMDERAGVREGYFEAAEFDWLEPEKTVERSVESIADRTIIHFPFGSVEKEYDPAVDAYLEQLATRVKETGERITLTGHTDNVGDDATNLELGRRRANGVRDILLSKGVKAAQITVDSKGKSQPTDTNDTEEGRHNNRRVEVRLIQQ